MKVLVVDSIAAEELGCILGNLNVNIASTHVGRKTKRGRAIVVLILDEDLTNDPVAEVASGVETDFARTASNFRASAM